VLFWQYVRLLEELGNGRPPTAGQFREIERYWIERIQVFFTSKPFKLEFDNSLSVVAVAEHLLQQASQRQKENAGTMYVDTGLRRST
jgi:hypothetical protein